MIADHGCGDATLKALEPWCVYATFGAKHYHTSHPFHSGGPFTKFTSLATSPCGPPSPAGQGAKRESLVPPHTRGSVSLPLSADPLRPPPRAWQILLPTSHVTF